MVWTNQFNMNTCMFTKRQIISWTLTFAIISVLFGSGCGSMWQFGRLPDTLRIEDTLKPGVSTRADVKKALGEPWGRGRVMFPIDDGPRDLWYYYYDETTLKDSQRYFLFVFFKKENYSGYMWFSSLPGLR